MRRLFSTLMVVTLASGMLAACDDGTAGNGASRAAAYGTDGTFTVALPNDPGAFNPYTNPLLVSQMYLAYDSLVNLTSDGSFVSGLAKSWKADATGATFTLTPDVTCSDGTPLTATQVAAAIEFVKNPKNQSPLAGLLLPSDPFTVKADDGAGTVTVALENPFSFVLNTIGLVPIVCAAGLSDISALAGKSFGTGPFVLDKVVPGDQYTLSRRQGYTWGPDGASTEELGTPTTVKLKVVTNETTAANLLRSGEVNLATIIGADRARLTAEKFPHFDVHLILGQFWFNQRDERPGADLAVRKALVSALDLDELSKVSTSGTGVRSTGLVSIEPKPCSGDTVSGSLPSHDFAAAAALLDEAGWTMNSDGRRSKAGKSLTIDLHYAVAGEAVSAAAELISRQWKDLGVQVKLTADDANALNATLFSTGDYDVYFKGINFTLPSQLVAFLSGPVPPDGQNFAKIRNPKYDRLAAKAAGAAGEAGCDLWKRAEQAIISNLDSVPVSDSLVPYFLNGAEAKANGSGPIPTSLRVLR